MGRGSWFRLVNMFNPELSGISAENAYWLSGENDGERSSPSWAAGCLLADTSLAEEACAMFYGRDEGQPCIVTAPAAKNISGIVLCGGSTWVRPDLRGQRLSQLLPRIAGLTRCG